MGVLICPICNSELSSKNSDNTLSCINKHSFDYAKEGYINLHVGKGSKNSGDDKIMVNSRRDFLNKGFYDITSSENDVEKNIYVSPTSSSPKVKGFEFILKNF